MPVCGCRVVFSGFGWVEGEFVVEVVGHLNVVSSGDLVRILEVNFKSGEFKEVIVESVVFDFGFEFDLLSFKDVVYFGVEGFTKAERVWFYFHCELFGCFFEEEVECHFPLFDLEADV